MYPLLTDRERIIFRLIFEFNRNLESTIKYMHITKGEIDNIVKAITEVYTSISDITDDDIKKYNLANNN